MAETALQVNDSNSQLSRPAGFGPQTFAEAIQFADRLAKSELVPKDYRGKPDNILVALQHGAELGLPPMQALNSIAVINGHPGIYGDAALAIVKGHKDFEWIKETFDDATMTAKCVVKRRNQPEVEQTFSKADAERADLWDERKRINKQSGGDMPNPSPWFCYPKRMLKFRARGFALRDSFPDALRGIKTAEEIADYPPDDGRTIEGQPVSEQTQPEAEKKPEPPPPTIAKDGGMAFYKAYRSHGWTSEEAAAWLRDNLQIGEPHNKKDSRDILVSDQEKAMAWATTKAPIMARVEDLFGYLGFTKDEAITFINERKADWVKIESDAKAELEKREAQEK